MGQPRHLPAAAGGNAIEKTQGQGDAPGEGMREGKPRRFIPWDIACAIMSLLSGILRGAFVILASAMLLSGIAFGIGFSYFRNMYDHCRQAEYDALSAIGKGTFSGLRSTVIYDKDDSAIRKIRTTDFKYTDIADISPYIQEAYIASEDQSFKSHIGIDPKGMLRAALALVKNRGQITQGGSTITQQLVKNTLLTQEQTFGRKLTEVFLAIDLEKKFTKAEIMEYYLNSNFYGNNCYGVYAACNYYFGKAPDRVTQAEAAMLAGISKSPSNYNPEADRKAALRQRDLILSLMRGVHVLTKKEYKAAKKEGYSLPEHQTQAEKESYMASYAVYCAALCLMEEDGFSFQYVFTDKDSYEAYKKGYQEAYRAASDRIRTGGYDIYTSLDPAVQNKLQDAVDAELGSVSQAKAQDGRYLLQGAAVCIDNSTGYVIAAAGGRGAEDEYNRAFLSTRQPGSAIKPILDYGPAFDTGEYYPSLVVPDEPIENGPKNSGGGYSGNVTVRYAITKSINTIPYRILQEIGTEQGLSYLGQMRFSSLSYIDSANSSAAIGGFTYGVRVTDMARAFHTIANGGLFSERTCIRRIKSHTEGNVYTDSNASHAVYESSTAYMLTSCLQDAIEEGTGKGLAIEGQECAGKTGTTNSYKDGWFCGYTNYYTTAAWVGNDDGSPVPGNYGAAYAGAVWKSFMAKMHEGLPKTKFPIPDTVEKKNVGEYGYPVSEKTGEKDWFAKGKEDEAEASGRAKEQEAEMKAAEQALSEYESFTIESEEGVYGTEDLYQRAADAIAACSDDAARKKLMKRLAKQKAKTDGEAAKWGELSLSRAEYDAQVKKQEEKRQRAAQKEEARQALYNSAVKRFRDQIGYAKELEYRSEGAYAILERAKKALGDLEGYSDYAVFQSEYAEAENYVESLPEEEEYDRALGIGGESSSSNNSGNEGGGAGDGAEEGEGEGGVE